MSAFQLIANELAVLRGETVTARYEAEYDNHYLDFGEYSLHVTEIWNKKDRWSISPSIPNEYRKHHRGNACPSITVAKNRDPKDIAKDIQNRLVEDAIAYHKKAKESYLNHEGERLEAEIIQLELIDASNGYLIEGNRYGEDQVERSLYCKGVSPSVTVRISYGTVTIEIRSLTRDKAAQLAAIMSGWKDNEKE